MFFDIDKTEEGTWFKYFDSHIDESTGDIVYHDPEEDAAEFKMRSMVQFFDERRRSRKKESKMVLNPKTGAMERVLYFSEQSADELKQEQFDAWDYAIVDWKNVLKPSGEEIECIAENKFKMTKIPSFLRFANRVFLILSGVEVKDQQDKEKN